MKVNILRLPTHEGKFSPDHSDSNEFELVVEVRRSSLSFTMADLEPEPEKSIKNDVYCRKYLNNKQEMEIRHFIKGHEAETDQKLKGIRQRERRWHEFIKKEGARGHWSNLSTMVGINVKFNVAKFKVEITEYRGSNCDADDTGLVEFMNEHYDSTMSFEANLERYAKYRTASWYQYARCKLADRLKFWEEEDDEFDDEEVDEHVVLPPAKKQRMNEGEF